VLKVLPHAVLALVGLAIAYWAATAEEGAGADQDEVEVFACGLSRLSDVTLTTERRRVEVEIRSEEGARVLRGRSIALEEDGEGRVDHWRGSAEGLEALEALAPLTARRSLGALEAAQLEEAGLTAPEDQLVVTCGGQTQTYDLGGTAYGTGDRYLRSAAGGPVYLLGRASLQPLQSPETQLWQRELHAFEPRELRTATVEVAGQTRSIVRVNPLDEARAAWVDAATTDRRDDLLDNWMGIVDRLTVLRYLGPEQEPGDELEESHPTAEPVATVTYGGEDGELGRVELTRVGETYYVRSELTGGWAVVTTSLGEQVRESARPVVGLEALPEETPAEAPTEAATAPEATEAESEDAAPSTPAAPAEGSGPTVE
jgi:hypothetical protein